MGAPVYDNLLEDALKNNRSPLVIALILEKGGTIPDDKYTKIPPECLERNRLEYNNYRMKIEKAKPIFNDRKQIWKDKAFLLLKAQMFDKESNLQELPSDIFLHLLSVIEQVKISTLTKINEKILCPKKHVYTNEIPDWILPIKNRECPVCSIKPELIISNPGKWEKKAEANLPLFREFLIARKDIYSLKSEFPILGSALIENDGQLTDNELIYICKNVPITSDLIDEFKDYCTAHNKVI